MAEFIAKKREMFLVQMSLDTKREEIRKLEEKARMKEEALRKSEQARTRTRDVVLFFTLLSSVVLSRTFFAAVVSGAAAAATAAFYFLFLLRVVVYCSWLLILLVAVPCFLGCFVVCIEVRAKGSFNSVFTEVPRFLTCALSTTHDTKAPKKSTRHDR